MSQEERLDETMVDVDGLDSGEDDPPPVLMVEEPQTWEEVALISPQTTSLHMQAVIDNVAKGQPIEFHFVDDVNVLCPLCAELVAFHSLFTDHLPNKHPGDYSVIEENESRVVTGVVPEGQKLIASEELLQPGQTIWEAEVGQYSLRSVFSEWPHQNEVTEEIEITSTTPVQLAKKGRPKFNLHIAEMDLDELNKALQLRVAEKLGEMFPVTLVDRKHARCGICHTVVSLNTKFEASHFIRHVNAWHAVVHKCAGAWLRQEPTLPKSSPEELFGQGAEDGIIRRLSIYDLSSTDYPGFAALNEDSLQCIRYVYMI